MRKSLRWLLLTTVFMLSIAMACICVASAAELPVIRIEPKDNTGGVGETFTVNITVTGITEGESLYGWECRITFNHRIINAVNATEGSFLKDVSNETMWVAEMNNTLGRVDLLAIFKFGKFPPTGAVGSGTLATVTFEIVGQGASSLEFKEELDTDLYTAITGTGGIKTTAPITHTAEGGFFRNAGPPIPLHLIAGIVVAIAICTGALFYFRKRRA